MSKLYVDGCSFTYGKGLSREYSLANLLSADIDMSQCGKSNNNIIYDTYKHIDEADIFVLGFTFSNRTTLWHNDIPLGVTPTKTLLDRLYQHPEGEVLEEKYKDYHRIFYTLFNDDYQQTVSDFFVDGIIEILKLKQKKFVVFSMEKRNCINSIFYPAIEDKLPDSHYNEVGMQKLSEAIKEKL